MVNMSKPTLHIFLDVDGVLNNTAAFILNKKTLYVLSDENLTAYQVLINKLRERYDLKIILSSTWREFKTGVNKLSKYSKKYNGLIFSDVTQGGYDRRENEILKYCDNHNISYDDILIIDDDPINNVLKDRHLKTNSFDGLRFSEVYKCLDRMFDIK